MFVLIAILKQLVRLLSAPSQQQLLYEQSAENTVPLESHAIQLAQQAVSDVVQERYRRLAKLENSIDLSSIPPDYVKGLSEEQQDVFKTNLARITEAVYHEADEQTWGFLTAPDDLTLFEQALDMTLKDRVAPLPLAGPPSSVMPINPGRPRQILALSWQKFFSSKPKSPLQLAAPQQNLSSPNVQQEPPLTEAYMTEFGILTQAMFRPAFAVGRIGRVFRTLARSVSGVLILTGGVLVLFDKYQDMKTHAPPHKSPFRQYLRLFEATLDTDFLRDAWNVRSQKSTPSTTHKIQNIALDRKLGPREEWPRLVDWGVGYLLYIEILGFLFRWIFDTARGAYAKSGMRSVIESFDGTKIKQALKSYLSSQAPTTAEPPSFWDNFKPAAITTFVETMSKMLVDLIYVVLAILAAHTFGAVAVQAALSSGQFLIQFALPLYLHYSRTFIALLAKIVTIIRLVVTNASVWGAKKTATYIQKIATHIEWFVRHTTTVKTGGPPRKTSYYQSSL